MKSRFLRWVWVVAVVTLCSDAGARNRYQALLATTSGRDTLLQLALWEDGRVTGNGRLFEYLKSDNPLVRLRTVEVIARIQDPQDTPRILAMLKDPSKRVVRGAIFALGQIGSENASPVLIKYGQAASPDMRLIVAEALGKIGGEKAIEGLLHMSRDFQSKIRSAAMMGLARSGDARAVDGLLFAVQDGDNKVVWRAIYALEKVESPKVSKVVLPFLDHSNVLIRAYAARTLGKQKDKKAVEKLIELLGDKDERVLVNSMNALASILEGRKEKKVVAPLGLILEKHPSHHARKAAVMTLGATGDKSAKDYLAQSILDDDAVIRAESYKALAKVLGKQAVVFLASGLNDSERMVRLATIEAYGLAGEKKQLDFLLTTASEDPDRLVRAAAVRALSNFNYDDVSTVLLQKLIDEDWVVVTEAVTALGEIDDKKAVQPLIDRYQMRDDRVDRDVRLEILSVLNGMKAKEAEGIARQALDDGDKRMRVAGLKLLETLEVEVPEILGDRQFFERDFDVSRKVGLSLPMGNKRAIIQCEYGSVELELYGDDATQTVANFIKLVRDGFYKKHSVVFHRVVPNFVVQGGCPRGDGFGDAGYYIRSEFNRHRYKRGMVGIAHSGKDSGGSQFFITHSSQPHLDGRYTIFGHVTKGMDVVNKIHQGDAFRVRLVK